MRRLAFWWARRAVLLSISAIRLVVRILRELPSIRRTFAKRPCHGRDYRSKAFSVHLVGARIFSSGIDCVEKRSREFLHGSCWR